MEKSSIKEIGENIVKAGKLETRPLCIYGSETVPNGAIPIRKINRCIAYGIFSLSVNSENHSIYIGDDVLEGCCPGGQAWFGFKNFFSNLKYFLSTGSENFRNGAAEFLLATPEIAEESLDSVGKITPLGKYIVIGACENWVDEDIKPKAILCFGEAEQIRNLCSLANFRPSNSFDIHIPWGPSCATFVTFPTGMAEKYPNNSITVGPTDPTGNYWFPPNYLAFGIPIDIAHRMSRDLEESFIVKRPHIAYPNKRTKL